MATDEERLFEVAPIPETLTLRDRFTVPPFTTIDGRSGWWRDRRNVWRSLGLLPEADEARAGVHTFAQGNERKDEVGKKLQQATLNQGGWSTFDPVLCELAYRWFCPDGGWILDPFAGSPVSGVVAAALERNFVGVELQAAEVDRNYRHADGMVKRGVLRPEFEPMWYQGDSAQLEEVLPTPQLFDFVWSCPPYFDLVTYSDDPADLSNMDDEHFRDMYHSIIANCVDRLKPNRFMGLVVAEVRGKDGRYRGFIPDTIRAAEDAGANFYNEAVQLLPIGTAAVRAAWAFTRSRKLCRTHQSILLFIKGDPKIATAEVSNGATDSVAARALGVTSLDGMTEDEEPDVG